MLLVIPVIYVKYVPVVTLSYKDDEKLLQQLKYGFKQKLVGINMNQA